MEYNIRANTYKDFFGSAMTIILVTTIIISLGIFLNNQADFGSIITELAGEDSGLEGMGSTLIVIILGLGVVVLLMNYLSIMNMKYTLGEDYIKVKQPNAMILSETIDVKFDNITRIFIEKTLNNKLLGGGNIVIELTGTKDKSIILKSIDSTEQVMQFIMQKMNEHKMQQQAQFQEGRKIEKILDKF